MINKVSFCAVSLSIALAGGCATFTDHQEQMRGFINTGKCAQADHYALGHFRDEYLRWQLGNVALNCHRNRHLAIDHYKAGAAANSKYSHLSVSALEALGERSPITREEIALKQCFNEARSEERSCALAAYGGVASIGAPIVRERQQVCTDRRMSAEEHCLRLHKPSALQGVPARQPLQTPTQPQQVIIQQQPLPTLPRVGPIIPGPTPYGR
jgi:hypothetical protein